MSPLPLTTAHAAPPRSRLAIWLLATRPKTLAAALAPVAVGTALAYGSGVGSLWPALGALLGALFIQIGTNLTNDYFDFKKGADTEERLGPVRVTQAGLLAPEAVFRGAMVCFGLALLVGLYLATVGGWPIVVIGILSLLSGYAYTGGPYPLGYNGLGDVFVLIFFGPVAVGGTFYVQAGSIGPAALLAGIPLGTLAAGLLAVNNLRDAATDVKAGKRTLVVRFGVPAGRFEYVLMVALAYATPLLLWALGFTGPWVLLALASFPAAIPPLRCVLRESGAPLNAALGGTARLLMLFGLLFAVGLYLGAAR